MKHSQQKPKQSKINVCDFCEYETISEINLGRHERDVHKITKSTRNEPTEEEENPRKNEEKKRAKQAGTRFPCQDCNYTAQSDMELGSHLEMNHRFRTKRTQSEYSPSERKINGICFFWNKGNCKFNELCRFLSI